ncbi:MAG: catechol 1,2-dioxygenase [Candidatus Symbiobacter sp.]|nr:catechol 1,2-dioxygenase [Candidatus Symbiobacter sp.]
MAEIIGAALLAHVPTIMLPEKIRRELNEGEDFSLVAGLNRFKTEVMEKLRPDLVIVFDSHWFTTVEFVVASQARRQGKYTSEELPRGMSQIPYDFRGDPDFAQEWAAMAASHQTWITPIDDPYLPVHYPTINLLKYLQYGDEAWVSISCAQTGESEDFLRVGRALRQAVKQTRLPRRIMLLASGAMSHKFWSLQQLRQHESAAAKHIFSRDHEQADRTRLAWMENGNHAEILATMPEFLRYKPEANFGHYLMMAAAMGEGNWRDRGILYSDYENSIGTGQVHVYFPLQATRI